MERMKKKGNIPMKARKVEIFPDVEQRKTIDEWIDVARGGHTIWE
jgi:hypothetical protein